jgi:hypothetical protein
MAERNLSFNPAQPWIIGSFYCSVVTFVTSHLTLVYYQLYVLPIEMTPLNDVLYSMLGWAWQQGGIWSAQFE